MTAQINSVLKAYFETENWLFIPGHHPYEVSSLGRIRNGNKILKLIKRGPKRKQYFAVSLGGGRGSSRYSVHRLVLLAFVGPSPIGALGCHKDDDSFNNCLSNLYWGSYKSNASDQIASGKFSYPNPLDTTKFNDDVVVKIREEYTGKCGEQSHLARKYNMSISNVHLIVHGKTRAA